MSGIVEDDERSNQKAKEFLTNLRETISEEPVVFYEETWELWKNETQMRDCVEFMAKELHYNVWWVRQLAEKNDVFVLPQFVRELGIDTTTSNWEVAVFSPKDYNWDQIRLFLLTHFSQFVPQLNSDFTLVELKDMIQRTYPNQDATTCFDMAANLVDLYSSRPDFISFQDMLRCYFSSLEDSSQDVFAELKLIGFPMEKMKLPDISQKLFSCLQQLEDLSSENNGIAPPANDLAAGAVGGVAKGV